MKKRFLQSLIHFTAACLACAAILITAPLPGNGSVGSGDSDFQQEDQVGDNNSTTHEPGINPLNDKDSFNKYRE